MTNDNDTRLYKPAAKQTTSIKYYNDKNYSFARSNIKKRPRPAQQNYTKFCSLNKLLELGPHLVLPLLLYYLALNLIKFDSVFASNDIDQWHQANRTNDAQDPSQISILKQGPTNAATNPKLNSSQNYHHQQQTTIFFHKQPTPTSPSANKSTIRSQLNNRSGKEYQPQPTGFAWNNQQGSSFVLNRKHETLLSLRNRRQVVSTSDPSNSAESFDNLDSDANESPIDTDSESATDEDDQTPPTTVSSSDQKYVDQPSTLAANPDSAPQVQDSISGALTDQQALLARKLPRSTLAVPVPALNITPRTSNADDVDPSNNVNNGGQQSSTLNRRTALANHHQRRSHGNSGIGIDDGHMMSSSAASLLPTMNVNMGGERILIKSASERPWPVSSQASSASGSVSISSTPTYGDFMNAAAMQQHDVAGSATQDIGSERHHHLDLLYPPPALSADAIEAAASARSPHSIGPSPQQVLQHERELHLQHQHLAMMMQQQNQPTGDLNARMDQLSVSGSDSRVSSQICYTPITLMLVILITMTATLVVAILTHYTMKQLSRRQFDLIESSKQFDSEHQRGIGLGNNNRFNGATNHNQKPLFMLGAASHKSHALSHLDLDDREHSNFNMIGYGGGSANCSANSAACAPRITGCRDLRRAPDRLCANELEHFAFDNPYFRADDEPQAKGDSLAASRQTNNNHQAQNNDHSKTTVATTLTSDTSPSGQQAQQGRTSAGLLAVVGQHQTTVSSTAGNNLQHLHHHRQATSSTASIESPSASCNSSLPGSSKITGIAQNYPSGAGGHGLGLADEPGLQDFIEHHISNLHSRQVTSSVKELSISGHPSDLKLALGPNCELREPPPIVDLRYDPRTMANAKEGDLVAVDLSGQDFIGLGFDIRGSVRDGIFISSILGSGPARDSGLIHRGDRIKCLNISFEGITLQDARDILNCGAPYKLRLLLEKGKECGRKNSTNRRKHLDQMQQQLSSLSGSNPSNPKRLRSKTMNFLSHQHHQSDGLINQTYKNNNCSNNSNGAFTATKSYIKKLGNLVSPSLSHAQTVHKSSSALDDVRTTPDNGDLNFQNPIVTSYSESELKTAYADQDQLGHGSLASKRHLSSGVGGPQGTGAMLDLATIGTEYQRQHQEKHVEHDKSTQMTSQKADNAAVKSDVNIRNDVIGS